MFVYFILCVNLFASELFYAWIQLLHESIYETFIDQLLGVYKQAKIGDPLDKGTLLGPLHTPASKANFEKGIQAIKSQV